MFLQSAVSPAILESKLTKSKLWSPLISPLEKHFDLLHSVYVPYGFQSFNFQNPVFGKGLLTVPVEDVLIAD